MANPEAIFSSVVYPKTSIGFNHSSWACPEIAFLIKGWWTSMIPLYWPYFLGDHIRAGYTWVRIMLLHLQCPKLSCTCAWNPKQPFINGCFNCMIPNLYIGNCCFTKHLFINGCLGFQVYIMCFGSLISCMSPLALCQDWPQFCWFLQCSKRPQRVSRGRLHHSDGPALRLLTRSPKRLKIFR